MPGAGQPDQADRNPHVGRVGRKGDRHGAQGRQKHGALARAVYAPAAPHEARGCPAASDRPDIGQQIDRDQRRAEIQHLDAILLVEEVRQPEEEGPPDRVNQEAAQHIGPGLAQPKQRGPFDGALFFDRVGFDPGQFLRAQALFLARAAVETEPGGQPDHAQQAGEDEGPAPAHGDGDDRHDQRSQDRADIGPGIEDTDSERPFLLGEPFIGCGDRGGEGTRFAQRERDAGDQHARGRGEEDMGDMADRPQRHRHRIARARPDPVDQSAEKNIGDAVTGLKPDGEVGIAALRPAITLLKIRLERRQDEAIDIGEHDRREQQGTNDPAYFTRWLWDVGHADAPGKIIRPSDEGGGTDYV